MSQEQWNAVDQYVSDQLIGADADLDAATAASSAGGLPSIAVAPPQGKLLHLLARAQGARRILEIGTLGGYSTIWLARALEAGGTLITLEAEPRHAEVARQNIAHAGFADMVDVRLGRALDTLPLLQQAGEAPFDFTFIDADKVNIPEYFDWAVKLSRRGAIIIVDNVVRDGELADAGSTDQSVLGVRRLHDQIHGDARVTATTIQTVGSKGYDGFTMAVVVG